jgi:hypothetical protein
VWWEATIREGRVADARPGRRRPLMGPAELIFLMAIGAVALILIMTA